MYLSKPNFIHAFLKFYFVNKWKIISRKIGLGWAIHEVPKEVGKNQNWTWHLKFGVSSHLGGITME